MGQIIGRRTAVVGALACVVAARAGAASAAGQRGPVEIVTDIYRRASAGKGDSGGTFLTGSSKARRAAFSRRTAGLWDAAERKTRKGEIGPIDFDVVTNSQDPEVKRFTVTAEEMGDSTARVAATIKGSTPRPKPVDETLRYVFVREGGRWMIDDIRGSADGQPWSVLEILKAA